MIQPVRRRGTVELGLAIGLTVIACSALARAVHADPMSLVEIGAAALSAAWLLGTARNLWRGHQLGRALAAMSDPTVAHGIRCRVIQGPERRAFVLGGVEPTIYVGETLLHALEPDELRAVLLHEEFHRRTHGPIRAASLEAWLTLLRPIGPIRRALVDRLVDLERAADRHALANGATPATIASALLKVDAPEVGMAAAFANAADRRVGSLLEFASGRASTPDRLPFEWVPPAAVALTVGLCHVFGVLTGS